MSHNTNTDILIAGAFAAFTVDLLVYPLDTIKTRIQSPSYAKLYRNAASNTVNRALFRGLYQGIGSVIIATVPSSGAFFTTYEATKSLLSSIPSPSPKRSDPLLPLPILNSISSSIAELVSCFILTPAEVLKQNAQVVRREKASPSSSSTSPKAQGAPKPVQIFDNNATRVAYNKFRSNPRALWTGYTALAARNLPFTALQFPMFEHLKASILESRKKQRISRDPDDGERKESLLARGTITAISAGSAGSIAAVITTPVDVVKTRIMLGAGDSNQISTASATSTSTAQGRDRLSTPSGRRRNGLSVGKEVFRQEGLRGLFRGGALRAAWTALGSGLYLGVYESGRSWLEEDRIGRGEGEGVG